MIELIDPLMAGVLVAMLGPAGASKMRGAPFARPVGLVAWRLLGVLEMATAAALIVPSLRWWGAVTAAALFLLFAVGGPLISRLTGSSDCACGSLIPLPKLGWRHSAVNTMLAGSAVAILASDDGRGSLGFAVELLLLALPAGVLLILRAGGEIVAVSRSTRYILR